MKVHYHIFDLTSILQRKPPDNLLYHNLADAADHWCRYHSITDHHHRSHCQSCQALSEESSLWLSAFVTLAWTSTISSLPYSPPRYSLVSIVDTLFVSLSRFRFILFLVNLYNIHYQHITPCRAQLLCTLRLVTKRNTANQRTFDVLLATSRKTTAAVIAPHRHSHRSKLESNT